MKYSNIISTDELHRHLEDSDWLIFDCRFELSKPMAGEQAYGKAHIPRAQYVHLDRDLAAAPNGKNGRHPLPDPEIFRQKLGSWGIDSSKQVVAYDDGSAVYASRFWWMLRWMGHEAAAVLDGGFNKWLEEDRPVTAKVPTISPTQFSGQAHHALYKDLHWLKAHLDQPGLMVLDARNHDRFNGIGETFDPVGGHIPGALNRFFARNFDEQGCFKPADELREEFQKILGDTPPEQVIHTCGSGVSACNNLLAMEVAGLKGSLLYPGSWSEWCVNP